MRASNAAARALKAEFGISRGDRVAILSLNRPDYLVLLYACARLGAMLVPLNWRLAVAEQLFILSDASVKVLVLEQAFARVLPALEQRLPEPALLAWILRRRAESRSIAAGVGAHGDGRNPHVDLTCPLLIVYTSGTTGRPKGAVLRQEALLWNAVMSQHMHGLTSDDHVLTVLPFFHVGGLNIQTTPALHQGATVTIHPRFTPDATLTTIARDRPTLTVLVPATMQALIEHPDWATTDLSSLQGGLDRIDDRSAASDRALCRARGAGAASLRLDRDLSGRDLYPPWRRSIEGRLYWPARTVLRGVGDRRGRQ